MGCAKNRPASNCSWACQTIRTADAPLHLRGAGVRLSPTLRPAVSHPRDFDVGLPLVFTYSAYHDRTQYKKGNRSACVAQVARVTYYTGQKKTTRNAKVAVTMPGSRVHDKHSLHSKHVMPRRMIRHDNKTSEEGGG
ncbi:unnamed protein product [Ectocarpus sp. 12 AP-2014]